MKKPLLSALAGLLATTVAHATLLVYDGYSYGSGTLNGVMPNPDTVGLNQTVAYAGGGAAAYVAGGASLTFSNLVTTGGSVSFTTGTNVLAGSVSLGAGTTTPYAGANVNTSSSAHTGTLYGSYLIRLTAAPGSATTFETRVADTTATSNMRFITAPDSRVSGNSFSSVSYDSSDVGTIPTTNSFSLGINTNYLVISRFTGVGTTLTAIDQSVATMYVLTSSQFDAFVGGGGNDSYLDSTALGTGAGQITARITDNNNNTTGTPDFATGRFIQYLAISSGGTLDETRYGTTLADVTPLIPEPSSLLLMGAAAALAGFRRRRTP